MIPNVIYIVVGKYREIVFYVLWKEKLSIPLYWGGNLLYVEGYIFLRVYIYSLFVVVPWI
jgi:hypothetical protein